ncbi:MAG: poly-beta-1,6 N-acetyl-D-glucosamine synthase [Firmicutes bacterium]|nr:poly-beta-1,6 N-acetyl-D-glucosamine synthase [Bacillota bacterium]HPU02007.1 poly-beta-1,6-N-acetyl-D-glucosamine synthase [Bacillota bacterium]
MEALLQYLALFVYFYPLVMSIIWTSGGLLFFITREWKERETPSDSCPPVTILMAAHNEEKVIGSTVSHLFQLDYPCYEVIVVDDGSTDNTAAILREMAAAEPRLRLVRLLNNMGKAVALNAGVRAARHEIIVTIDADSYLDKEALRWLVRHFTRNPRTGAVTGNPRVLNRTSLLARIQTAEYSSIIGMIKRTQSIWGRLMTVSGVLAAYRLAALVDVNFWSTDSVTEDIDITWKLQRRSWEVHYEPRALVWVLVPETLRGLWKQRLRWSRGGIEVLRKNYKIFKSLAQGFLWPLYLESLASVCWAVLFLLLCFFWPVGSLVPAWPIKMTPLALWGGTVLLLICLLQFAVAVCIDQRYDRALGRTYFSVIWYPVAYWLFNCLVTVCALPRGLFCRLGCQVCAHWSSPDRGYITSGELT